MIGLVEQGSADYTKKIGVLTAVLMNVCAHTRYFSDELVQTTSW
jgi:hypothetical protein